MSTATYTGIVHGKSVFLEDAPSPLADGTRVLVTPLPEPGTTAALLAAIQAAPHVPAEWVDELEQLIAEGQRPATHDDPFASEAKT